ncbi:anthranilate phosphoribosyltransferase [Staphylococcus argensis]|uniref:anthranilate phosphoribosyltransferase n=1 Tax=Staphylococcus argensis TaxID=1607738 RepID=UPI0011A0F344|nr:anthranilate phosphoribosyltransferase [Staphylococcus argensis]
MALKLKLQQQQALTQSEINDFVALLISPDVGNEEKRNYLQAFSNKDYSQKELTYLSRALIHTMYDPQPYYPDDMCVCGTGGDRSNSLNISTTVSFIVASAGVPVIKHGNKSITSASGSTDLLAAMAINTTPVAQTPAQLQETHLAFLSATETFPVMKHIQPVRKMIDTPTVFNIIGPIINPFQLDYQVMGVYDAERLPHIAQTLHDLGRRRAIVVHGAGGMDEATLSGENIIYEVNRDQGITHYTLNAEDVGLHSANNTELVGGTRLDNLQISERILRGEDDSAKYEVVLLNAGLALYVAEKAETIREGVELARTLIQSGKAYDQYQSMKGEVHDYIG